MNELMKHLRPLKKKLMVEKLFNQTLLCLSIVLCFSAAVLVMAKFIYIPKLSVILPGILIISLLAGALSAYINRPDAGEIAAKADALGFKERFVTAVELSGKGPGNPVEKHIVSLVLNDAVTHAQTADFRKLYKISVSRKKQIGLMLSVGLIFVSGFTPSPAADKIAAQKMLDEKIATHIDSLASHKEALLDEAGAAQAKEIEAIIKEMNKSLKAAKSEAEAIQATKKAQEELTKLSKDTTHKDLKELGEKLKQHENTKSLGEALESGDTSHIERELQLLNRFLETAGNAEKEEIARLLKEAAAEIAGDNSLREGLNDLSDAITSGNLGALGDEIKKFNEKMEALSRDSQALREAMEEYKEALSATAGEMQQGNQNADGQEPKAGQGESNGQQGTERQNGDGASQESGNSGEGEGAMPGGNPGGSGRGTGHIENEEVYTRNAAGKEDVSVNITGEMTEMGEISQQEQKRIGEAGESVPYDQVYQSYKDEALRSLEDYDIPYGMREIVKDYFSTLE